MKKLVNSLNVGFFIKALFLISFSLAFKQLSFGQGSFASLIGDAASNSFSKIKPFTNGNNTNLYACGSRTIGGTTNATFSKISSTGTVLWSVTLNTPSSAFDFEKIEGTNTNEFYLVGRTEPSNVGDDNKSFISKITENAAGSTATVGCVNLYDQNGREAFIEIIKKNVNNSWKYYVGGLYIDGDISGSYDHGAIHVFDGKCTLLNRWRYTDLTAFDNELARGLINWGNDILVHGGRRGNDGNNFGNFYTINPTTGVIGASKRLPNNVYIIDAYRGAANGDLYISGNRLGTSNSYIARLDGTTFNPKWEHELTGDNVLYDISQDSSGHLYAISQTPGTNIYWINKIKDNGTNASLVYSRKILEGGSTDNSFSSGHLHVNPSASFIYYADSRVKVGGVSGFGQTDIVVLKQGLNLENFSCKEQSQKAFPPLQDIIENLPVDFTILPLLQPTTAQGGPLAYERKPYCGQPCTASFTATQKPCGIVQVTNTSTGSPSSYTWCNGASTTSIPDITLNCNQTITVCLTAVCKDGTTSTATNQVFNYTDNTPPTISCPANKTINCDASVLPANTGSPTSQDNCGIKGTTYVDGTSVPVQPCGTRFIRTWTVEDNCGNKSTCTQTITLIDSTPPVIVCPPNKILTCGTENVSGITGIATATDNCTKTADITITPIDVVNGIPNCDQTIFRTWTAKDKCGNTATCVQTISIIDNVKPVITNCPPNVTITGTINPAGVCQATLTLTNPTATDNCDLSVTITNNAPAVFPVGNTTVIWTATDDCKNTATCSTVVTVKCEPVSTTNKCCPTTKMKPCCITKFEIKYEFTVNIPTTLCGMIVKVSPSAGITSSAIFPGILGTNFNFSSSGAYTSFTAAPSSMTYYLTIPVTNPLSSVSIQYITCAGGKLDTCSAEKFTIGKKTILDASDVTLTGEVVKDTLFAKAFKLDFSKVKNKNKIKSIAMIPNDEAAGQDVFFAITGKELFGNESQTLIPLEESRQGLNSATFIFKDALNEENYTNKVIQIVTKRRVKEFTVLMFDEEGLLVSSSTVAGAMQAIVASKELKSTISSMSIVPNPASEEVNFSYTLQNAQNVSVDLYDLSGKLLRNLDKGYKFGNQPQSVLLNVSEYSNGMYLIRLTNEQGQSFTEKLSVVR